jgi:hypothetical protein
MGQYYKPIILKEDKQTPIGFANSHDFGSGLKLMEHSWIENDFVGFIESLLTNGMPFHKTPIVWAGDYADEEPFERIPKEVVNALVEDGYELEEVEKNGANLYSIAFHSAPKLSPNTLKIVLPIAKTKYIVNHDKKQFVDKTKVPQDADGWRIHPLPLLTVEGNLRGGGDYFSENGKEFVGSWARDIISIESKKADIPKDYVEIIPNFME